MEVIVRPTAPSESEQLVSRLRGDRLIELYIGDESQPYRIQQSLLESASDYFVKAIKDEHLGEENVEALKFPEDGDYESAWSVVLYYIVHKQLPQEYIKQDELSGPTQVLLIRAWALGDRLLMPRFQDLVMLELLWYYDGGVFPPEILQPALDASPYGSELRQLVAEEVIYAIYQASYIKQDDLLACDGVTGLSSSLLTAFSAYVARGRTIETRIKDRSSKWINYMVDGGPEQHRLHLNKKLLKVSASLGALRTRASMDSRHYDNCVPGKLHAIQALD